MISYREAMGLIAEVAGTRALPSERVALSEALGRVAAEDVTSPEAVPPFANSAMDGFALETRLTESASATTPVRIPVAGTVAAGDRAPGEVRPGEGFEIMTGAPMPGTPCDAVVRLESVQVERDARGQALAIRLTAPVRPGDNVRERGEDFLPGHPVLSAGSRLCSEHLMALAGVGVGHLNARRRPRVALISTGRELVESPGAELAPGMIRNSTAPYLMAALPALGVDAKYFGAVPDEPEQFEQLLARALSEAPDVVITTGAVSMGKHDFVGASVKRMGAATRFHKVAIRPGRPLLFAEFPGGPALFGTPGNPVSTAVALRFFVAPYLRRILGMPAERPFSAKLERTAKKPEGLRCFLEAVVRTLEGEALVEILPRQASFMVSPLLRANAWALLPEDGAAVTAGSVVELLPLHPWSPAIEEAGGTR